MAHLIPNNFSSFELTLAEEESGQVLNTLQKMVLQNKLAAVAAQKLHLVYVPNDPKDYAQQMAYLQGQLDVLQWQLDTSTQVEEILAAKLAAQPNQ